MLVKCICTNCAGHLEFEEENAGETIPCPHCGFETVLTLPGTQALDPELLALSRRLALRRRLVPLIAGLLVVAVCGYALYRWGVPWLQDLMPSVDTTAKAMVVLILGCALVPLAIFWLVFPILLFLQLRKGTQLLNRIAESLESPPSAPLQEAEESSAEEAEVEEDAASE